MTISQLEARMNVVEGEGRAALAALQDQFDTLAIAHAEALQTVSSMAIAVAELSLKIDPRVAPDLAAFAKFILPRDGVPAHREFDRVALMASIGERQVLR